MNLTVSPSTSSALLRTQSTPTTTGVAASTGDGAAASASSTGRASTSAVSGLARSLGALQDLATSDPDAFKAAAADIAQQLRGQLGEDETGPLADLVSRFEAAAESGDASGLAPSGAPPAGPPPGGAPPGPPPEGGAPPGPPPGGARTRDASQAYRSESARGGFDPSSLQSVIEAAMSARTTAVTA